MSLAVLVISSVSVPAHAEGPCGDVNANGVVDLIDTVLITRHASGLAVPTEFDSSRCSVDAAGAGCFESDAVAVRDYLVGNVATLPSQCIAAANVPPNPDVNGDGSVDALDASLVGSCQELDLVTNPQCATADVDGDGDVDEDDLQRITDAYGASCGDGVVNLQEVCDGSDDTACPGLCLADCTCDAGAPPNPDVNGDGSVDALDASLVGSCQGLDFATYPQCAAADVDGDGDVDEDDLQQVSDAYGASCGDDVRNLQEACDGSDDAACPGLCLADCTCGTGGGDTTPPVVRIDAPQNGAVVTTSPVAVSGTVEDLSPILSLSVCGQSVSLAANAFATTCPIDLGPNTIQVSATDSAGNLGSAEVSVTLGVCEPGSTQTCYSGPSGTEGVGVCAAGTRTCIADGSGYGACTEVVPSTESCNGLDDDCDGLVDEGLSGCGLTLDGPLARAVQTADVQLTGTIDSDFAGTIVATSDRMPGTEFAGVIMGPGTFSVELLLAVGLNRVTVTAKAGADIRFVEAEVTRLVPPAITISSPRPNSVVDQEVVRIVGEILDPVTQAPPRVEIQNKSVDATPSGSGAYDFAVDNVLLAEGLNQLLVEAYSDQLVSSIVLPLTLDTDEEPAPDPLVTITSPVVNSFLSSDGFELVGTVQSFTGLPELRIDSVPIELILSGDTGAFRELYSFSEAAELELTLEARDAAGRTTTQTIVYRFDDLAPTIAVDGDLLAAPELNVVETNPFQLAGTVADANLASLTINDNAVGLNVIDAENFGFAADLVLQTDSPTAVRITATDLAGNAETLAFEFQTDATQFLEPLVPMDGAEFVATDASVAVDVAARVSDVLSEQQVVAFVEPNSLGLPPVVLDVGGDLASGEVLLPAVTGSYAIVFEIRNALDDAVARGQRSVRVEVGDVGDLTVTRVEPANEADGVEPNQFISVYLNQAIDPALLSIDVFETAHGLTYVSNDEPGTEALFAMGAVLEEVNRDRAPVPGKVSVLPGERVVAFYPDQNLAYGADVFVAVVYDGEPLERWTYAVRPLPTFIIGGVADQLQQVASGLEVAIPALGRSTQTNEDGAFAFGFGDASEARIPSGRYELVLNPDLANREYGTVSHWITVQEGRKNEVGLKRVPILNSEVGFRLVESGEPQVILAGGEVVLDLSEATLIFPDSRTSGAVHVQFNTTSQVAYDSTPHAIPHWMYGFQPGGIMVNGDVSVDFALPELFGSTDYVMPEAPYVLMVGIDDGSSLVAPVGVGLVENGRVRSVGPLSLSRLDYVGISFVPVEKQNVLRSFAEGELSLQQMLAELTVEP